MREFGIPKEINSPISFVTLEELQSHREYRDAKAGSKISAGNLVADILSKYHEEIRYLYDHDVIFVSPFAIESSGNNMIPLAMSEYLASIVGAHTDVTAAIQTNKVYHTGAKMMERIIAQPQFSGNVKPGGKYVLVDDVTMGGSTMAAMANHIRSSGGIVVGISTLTNRSRFDSIQPSKKSLNTVEERLGDALREEFSIDPQTLTASEASYLAGFRNANELRNRVIKAGSERIERLFSKGILISKGVEQRIDDGLGM